MAQATDLFEAKGLTACWLGLVQAIWGTVSSSYSMLPATVAAACAAFIFVAKRRGWLGAPLQTVSNNLVGWSATSLFMFQPLAQLVITIADILHPCWA